MTGQDWLTRLHVQNFVRQYAFKDYYNQKEPPKGQADHIRECCTTVWTEKKEGTRVPSGCRVVMMIADSASRSPLHRHDAGSHDVPRRRDAPHV